MDGSMDGSLGYVATSRRHVYTSASSVFLSRERASERTSEQVPWLESENEKEKQKEEERRNSEKTRRTTKSTLRLLQRLPSLGA